MTVEAHLDFYMHEVGTGSRPRRYLYPFGNPVPGTYDYQRFIDGLEWIEDPTNIVRGEN